LKRGAVLLPFLFGSIAFTLPKTSFRLSDESSSESNKRFKNSEPMYFTVTLHIFTLNQRFRSRLSRSCSTTAPGD